YRRLIGLGRLHPASTDHPSLSRFSSYHSRHRGERLTSAPDGAIELQIVVLITDRRPTPLQTSDQRLETGRLETDPISPLSCLWSPCLLVLLRSWRSLQLGFLDEMIDNATHTTAVVVIPPADAWPPIQALRERYDRQFRRWMPHITLLYPFRPRAAWPAIIPG